MDISEIINELGEDRDSYFHAIAPPIIQTSNFAFRTVDIFRQALSREYDHMVYSRGKNPTTEIIRKKLAALDEAEDCLVVNSGAAAIFLSVFANVNQGDHIISVADPYSWAFKLFTIILPRFGITCSFVNGSRIENFASAIRPETRLIYLETPNSWNFELQDLEAVAQLAKPKNIITICDNSYSTPLFQKPIPLGIDISIQSATKYISGHSDTVAGVISASSEMIKKIFSTEFMSVGSGIQPMNAWFLLRGLRTLPLRLQHGERIVRCIMDYLDADPRIGKVIHPFHKDFTQKELAGKQMKGAGSMLTFTLADSSLERIEQFCNNLKHILMAVSWGGYESLVIPRAATMPAGDFNPLIPGHHHIRLYAGLEEPEYIIKDIRQSLDSFG